LNETERESRVTPVSPSVRESRPEATPSGAKFELIKAAGSLLVGTETSFGRPNPVAGNASVPVLFGLPIGIEMDHWGIPGCHRFGKARKEYD
jgi:hypothetical protein